MFVCVCNALGEDQVRNAARKGAPCPRAAYLSLGCEPQCCSCLEHAAEIIEQERSNLLAVESRAA
jgi:bacterioferritin-associated ferredoxin